MIVNIKRQLLSDFMSGYEKVFDVPHKYEYLYTKEVNGEIRVWGAYVTYWRWHWDNKVQMPKRDKAILFSGVVGKKFRFTKSVNNNRLGVYANKHRKDGYKCMRYENPSNCMRYENPSNKTILGAEFNKLVQERFPDIHEGINKQLFWLTLKE